MGLLKGVLDLGLEFEDLRDIAVEVCWGIVEGQYHPHLLCPGIVDTFGPHVSSYIEIFYQVSLVTSHF